MIEMTDSQIFSNTPSPTTRPQWGGEGEPEPHFEQEGQSGSQPCNVIVANGEPPAHPWVVALLRRAAHIICCDGAVAALEHLGLEPAVVVGDGDSLTAEQRARYADYFEQDASTDYNDLTKAFNYCRRHGLDDLWVVGAGGRRDDHALANLGLLVRHAREFQVRMATNFGIFTPISATTEFAAYAGQQVSVFSFTPACRLTFHGLRYPVRERAFSELWEGSLNEALGDNFTVELCDEGEVLVYQPF